MKKNVLVLVGVATSIVLIAIQWITASFVNGPPGGYVVTSISAIAGKLAFVCAIAPFIIAGASASHRKGYLGILLAVAGFFGFLTLQDVYRYEYSAQATDLYELQEIRLNAVDITNEFNQQNHGLLKVMFPQTSETGETRKEYIQAEEKIAELIQAKKIGYNVLVVLKNVGGDSVYARLKEPDPKTKSSTVSIRKVTNAELEEMYRSKRIDPATKKWLLNK